jgi:phosphate starvation-inducible PhoH-like protein
MTEKLNIKFENSENFRNVMGPGDSNKEVLETLTKTKIFTKGEYVNVKLNEDSIAVEKIEKVMKALIEIAANNNILRERDIIYVFKQCAESKSCRDIIDIYINKTQIAKSRQNGIYVKSMNQKKYFELIENNDVVFGIGPAGTGKTFIPIVRAAYLLKTNQIKRLILTRPIVEAEEKLGFLPGDMMEKVDPYLRPLYDGLQEIFTPVEIEKLIEDGKVEVAPLAYMRGRTLDDAFIILDEAQNTTKGQMKLFLTRLGFGSKMVITGDITQVDLPRNVKSGLRQAIETLKDVKNVGILEFETSDIVRHPIVQTIVENFDNNEWTEE